MKAPDWVYVPSVEAMAAAKIRRSYTPHAEGSIPSIVLEFISETEGGEYSINHHYPYGKWYFYEQILQIPVYGIFQPQTGELDVYRLVAGKYEQQLPDENNHYWLEEIQLFLGVWQGSKAEFTTYWLRWWDQEGNLLLWGSELLTKEKQQAEQARQLAEQARQLAEQEKQRAEQEKQRAEQAELALEQERIYRQLLVQKLRELGVEPDTL